MTTETWDPRADATLAEAVAEILGRLDRAIAEAAEEVRRAARAGDAARARIYADGYFGLQARREEVADRAAAWGVAAP